MTRERYVAAILGRVARRSQLIPWKVAGRRTDEDLSADDVVRRTGWLFSKDGGAETSLAEFVAAGTEEVESYVAAFDLAGDGRRALLEIGSGIGRMTCAFTERFRIVYACDLDEGFLERCREAVVRFGRIGRLRTVVVPDGRTLDVTDDTADVAFSYITLQHCSRDDALALTAEAIRVVRPGGTIALNFRTHTLTDTLLLPIGFVARALISLPGVGGWLSQRRTITRLAWQVSRLDPHHVLQPLGDRLSDVAIWRHPDHDQPLFGAAHAERRTLATLNPAHWWLVARVRE